MGNDHCEYVSLDLDVSNGTGLYLLLDTGADISLLTNKNVRGTAEFEPNEKVRVKSVYGSVIETHEQRDQNKRGNCRNSIYISISEQTG
jgi:hypothetical protein